MGKSNNTGHRHKFFPRLIEDMWFHQVSYHPVAAELKSVACCGEEPASYDYKLYGLAFPENNVHRQWDTHIIC